MLIKRQTIIKRNSLLLFLGTAICLVLAGCSSGFVKTFQPLPQAHCEKATLIFLPSDGQNDYTIWDADKNCIHISDKDRIGIAFISPGEHWLICYDQRVTTCLRGRFEAGKNYVCGAKQVVRSEQNSSACNTTFVAGTGSPLHDLVGMAAGNRKAGLQYGTELVPWDDSRKSELREAFRNMQICETSEQAVRATPGIRTMKRKLRYYQKGLRDYNHMSDLPTWSTLPSEVRARIYRNH